MSTLAVSPWLHTGEGGAGVPLDTFFMFLQLLNKDVRMDQWISQLYFVDQVARLSSVQKS